MIFVDVWVAENSGQGKLYVGWLSIPISKVLLVSNLESDKDLGPRPTAVKLHLEICLWSVRLSTVNRERVSVDPRLSEPP